MSHNNYQVSNETSSECDNIEYQWDNYNGRFECNLTGEDTWYQQEVPSTSRADSTTKNTSRQKRERTAFTSYQLDVLEEVFAKGHYVNRTERIELAEKLGLKDKAVKVWFQNRRMKYKKDGHRVGQMFYNPTASWTNQNTSISNTKMTENISVKSKNYNVTNGNKNECILINANTENSDVSENTIYPYQNNTSSINEEYYDGQINVNNAFHYQSITTSNEINYPISYSHSCDVNINGNYTSNGYNHSDYVNSGVTYNKIGSLVAQCITGDLTGMVDNEHFTDGYTNEKRAEVDFDSNRCTVEKSTNKFDSFVNSDLKTWSAPISEDKMKSFNINYVN